MPFGWKGWAGLGVGALVLMLALQFGGAAKTWWAKRGIHQAQEQGARARDDIAAARAEAELLKAERARQLREIDALKRQRDAALASASRERAEARRLVARADELERARRAEPRVRSLTEARDAFKALGY